MIAGVLSGWAGPAAQSTTGAVQTTAVAARTGRASYFANADLRSIWTDLESRQVINKRVLEGGTHSINVRIVTEGDAPLVHAASADVWIVTEGTSIAVTGGQLIDPRKRPNSDDEAGAGIRDGVEQPLQAGDVLYVPAGVPHGFRTVRGFRALLVRFDTK
jgi:mannose-6-phosphate isomerase-like protein (cupin superfamily)